jgi:hypothetical protein
MLQLALQISKNCIFLNLGFFCCFDSPTTVSEQRTARMQTGIGNGMLLQ